mgnify:FL=1
MRYERKYKIERLSLAVVQQAIRMHPASFRSIYPDRQINNIYFDTIGLRTFHDNVDGIADRKKYRVRWYNRDIWQISQPNFEIKIRQNQLGTKEVCPIADFDLANLSVITSTVNKLSHQQVPLRPVLINSYLRSYYGTSDGRYRITIDRDLRYFSCLNSRRFTTYNIVDKELVLEIKYDELLDNDSDRIMQHFPFRQTKSSKYVTGVLLSNPF